MIHMPIPIFKSQLSVVILLYCSISLELWQTLLKLTSPLLHIHVTQCILSLCATEGVWSWEATGLLVYSEQRLIRQDVSAHCLVYNNCLWFFTPVSLSLASFYISQSNCIIVHCKLPQVGTLDILLGVSDDLSRLDTQAER